MCIYSQFLKDFIFNFLDFFFKAMHSICVLWFLFHLYVAEWNLKKYIIEVSEMT